MVYAETLKGRLREGVTLSGLLLFDGGNTSSVLGEFQELRGAGSGRAKARLHLQTPGPAPPCIAERARALGSERRFLGVTSECQCLPPANQPG